MAGLNLQNIMLIGGGLVSLFWARVGWKKGWNIIPTIGGIAAIGLGAADATGIVDFIKNKKQSGYVGVYPYYDPRTGSYIYPRY